MITKIIIKGASSFPSNQSVEIKDLGRVNIFYGHNGSGKTTIGNVIERHLQGEFPSCTVTFSREQPETLVFNDAFVQKNFRGDDHPGVFTLNADNIEIDEKILDSEKHIEALRVELEKEKNEGLELKSEQEATEKALISEIWKEKKRHDGLETRECFNNYHNDAKKFATAIKSLQPKEVNKSPEALAEEYSKTKRISAIRKAIPQTISFSGAEIEELSILKEPIIGTGESSLKEIVEKLGHSDWVLQSKVYVTKSEGACPLCLQTPKINLLDEIEKLFDDSYKTKKKALQTMHESYVRAHNALISMLSSSEAYCFDGHAGMELEKAKNEFDAICKRNIQKIQEKIETPAKEAALETTKASVQKINEAIEKCKSDALNHNQKIIEKESLLKRLSSEVWSQIRHTLKNEIIEAEIKAKKIEEALVEKRKTFSAILEKIKDEEKAISSLREKTKNIDSAIEKINQNLSLIGITGFKIISKGDNSQKYKIIRENEKDNDVFKTLSEGEKTLITFLYFLECCEGTHDTKKSTRLKDRIVVIDDPISSLSHNHVYDVASLIHHKIIMPEGKYRQIIILTHNMYFLNELQLLGGKKSNGYKFYRVIKSEYSHVLPMKKGEIKNEYQSYWQALKDVKNGQAQPIMLPNIIRSILEYYFGFVQKRELLESTLNDMGKTDKEFSTLFRFINRGSHADEKNITDFGRIEPEKYLLKFEEIYTACGDKEHFQAMMNGDDEGTN